MASSAKKSETSFETAMERLEKIVEEMESGKMLLEDLLVRYEEGMKLVKVCQDRLAHAEHDEEQRQERDLGQGVEQRHVRLDGAPHRAPKAHRQAEPERHPDTKPGERPWTRGHRHRRQRLALHHAFELRGDRPVVA